ncbi:hypothetical protein V8B55DRAFT_1528790 [Mucor lusitanicus]|uniref:Uncharacterized protein n=2 Tax=Mucor circinelloides f. lusitanicus TaxID=29924 RepID=A0A162QAX5_MUCCL|nr:hypothetical protein FB192DRAFT_1459525 [Mucor lusitanicus]OAD00400.1 hypothetical protein MUCCIDRAFT_89514 [Mucor lusitanicus CBS 277.49]
MRFTTSATFLVLFFAIISVAFATRITDSDSIHDGLTQNYLVRRADDDSTAASGHGQASASSTAQTSAATDASATASTSSEKGKKSSSTAETAATSTAATTTKKKNNSSFASPEILQTGTLFYIGVSVTTLLWITGKAIDVQTNRQERYAESLVHSI